MPIEIALRQDDVLDAAESDWICNFIRDISVGAAFYYAACSALADPTNGNVASATSWWDGSGRLEATGWD
jgi:hypothetical protein